MDSASALLAQHAVNGNSGGRAQIDFVEVHGGEPTTYLRYEPNRCFIKSWSTSDDAGDRPAEAVAISFSNIAFAVAGGGQVFSWDRVKQKHWNEHGLQPIPAVG